MTTLKSHQLGGSDGILAVCWGHSCVEWCHAEYMTGNKFALWLMEDEVDMMQSISSGLSCRDSISSRQTRVHLF